MLSTAYPLMQMDRICRLCRGNATKNRGQYRCGLCKMALADYKKAGMEAEVAEWDYLHTTWLKARSFQQVTTGIAKLDFIIEKLFGKPHKNNWRNYKLVRPKLESKFVVMRMVGES